MEKDAKSYEAWGRHSGVVRRQMYDIYLNKVKKKNPKITRRQIEKWCEHDKIFTADQAVEMGLADGIFVA
jgi:ATP-dependent protease ClpP protease subunit